MHPQASTGMAEVWGVETGYIGPTPAHSGKGDRFNWWKISEMESNEFLKKNLIVDRFRLTYH